MILILKYVTIRYCSPSSNSWTPLQDPMPVAVAYAAGAVLGSEFWIMGGSDDSGKKTKYIQVKCL
jgi:hypothetical protein